MPLARQALHETGEDIHVAVWPTVKEMNLVACRQYAFEGRCWVIACGAVMDASALPDGLDPHPDLVRTSRDLLLRGGSAIIAPDGQVVAGPVPDTATIVTADISLDKVREESMNLDVTGHYSRPDVFRLERTPQKRNPG
jgi:predicted amidohydrolase